MEKGTRSYFLGGTTVLNEYVPKTNPPNDVANADLPTAASMACFALIRLISAGSESSNTAGALAPISYFLIVILVYLLNYISNEGARW